MSAVWFFSAVETQFRRLPGSGEHPEVCKRVCNPLGRPVNLAVPEVSERAGADNGLPAAVYVKLEEDVAGVPFDGFG